MNARISLNFLEVIKLNKIIKFSDKIIGHKFRRFFSLREVIYKHF